MGSMHTVCYLALRLFYAKATWFLFCWVLSVSLTAFAEGGFKGGWRFSLSLWSTSTKVKLSTATKGKEGSADSW